MRTIIYSDFNSYRSLSYLSDFPSSDGLFFTTGLGLLRDADDDNDPIM